MTALEVLRQELAEIDEELMELFLRRMEVIERVASQKKETKGAIYVPQQEERILARIQEQVPSDLTLYARSLQRTLMRLSRERQYELLLVGEADVEGESKGVRAVAVVQNPRGDSLRLQESFYPQAQITEVTDLDSAYLQVEKGLVDLALLPMGDELLFRREKHALYIQACFMVDTKLYAALGDTLRIPRNPGLISLLLENQGGPELAQTLSTLLTILSDLELPVLQLRSLGQGALHLEFPTDPGETKGARALQQILQEADDVYLVGWYDQSFASISSQM